MRMLWVLVLAGAASAQSQLRVQDSHSTQSLRGISAVSREVAWASGAHGTYLRTRDGGRTWIKALVPNAEKLDFRGVVAFSWDEAFLMASGPGGQSRIYHSFDGGKHWHLQFTNANPKGFFDSIAFWDAKHGIVLGDPVPDENGKLKFELLETEDGESWHAMRGAGLPEAVEGEGAFAASNTCVAVLHGPWKNTALAPPHTPMDREGVADPNIWFATGGKVARVFHSADRGHTWEVHDTPIVHGPDSAGIFSIAFRNSSDGVIAGGNYKEPDADGPNLAFTHDGGKTWTLATIYPQAYFSAIGYDDGSDADLQKTPRVFAVGRNFILDVQPPVIARRLHLNRESSGSFNAISVTPAGGAFVVGAKGMIARIPEQTVRCKRSPHCAR